MENVKFNPVGWFEIYVENMDRAAKFYEDVLGYKVEQLPMPDAHELEMRAFPSDMMNPGAAGALVKMEGMKGGSGGTLIYFGTEDCGVAEAKVEAAGGKVCQPKMSIGDYGFCSIVSDTEGNTIGLHSMI
ncbi:VOC family protein [Myroides sp. JBRI-B21084]|uniref:VOC family protein n=1 Tax=Myroides sp. JBRI-B21084 TaxID=3119977 RepID=UPI0026E138EB|nr:VOC family protein [Paenimyroides cloacae]WKW46915.1 VOC family protein [Paenimyroides cloacae]